MDSNETSVNTEKEKPLIKPIMYWAEVCKTPRWLLCLAAVEQAWLPEQEDDAVDELTKEAYEAAVEQAKNGYEEAAKNNRGKRMVKALVHDSLLIACVVRRIAPGEERVLIEKVAAAAEEDQKKAGDMVQQQFQQVIIFPKISQVIAVRDLTPRAYFVLASKWQLSLGMEAEQSAKKR